MTPEQLVTFSHAAQHLNISHAAVALHLSQPAVSGQLQALQASFGEPLYHRQGRGIALTPAGQRLLVMANQIRDAMHQAQAQKSAARALETGVLRIGASTTPASYLLPEAVARFRKQYPRVSVQLVTGNTTDIMARLPTLDLAVIEGEPEMDKLSKHNLIQWQTDEVVAVLRHDHPLANRQSLALTDLVDQSLVMREDGSGVRHMVMKAFSRIGVFLPDYLELAGVEGIKQGVRAGLGVGFVSRLSLRHEDQALIGVPLSPPLIRAIRILLPAAPRQSRGAQVFIEQLTTAE
jgi:DNA-binding transcriptional LysR family regulator